MKTLWPGLVLVCALSLPVSAQAADATTVGVGTGAVAGALVGGPIGAVVGAVAGGVIGAHSRDIRRGARRRARVAHRRGFAARPAKARPHFSERRASAPSPIRPVAATSPARPSGSETGARRGRETQGGGWKDPD